MSIVPTRLDRASPPRRLAPAFALAPVFVLVLAVTLIAVAARPARAAEPEPVRVGITAEFGVNGSTSAQAILMGARIAVDEINAAGGVLGGRKLEIVVKDDRSVPARAIRNLQDFAADPSVVAVLCGKYSPVVVEAVPEIQRLKLPFLDPWAAADSITEHTMTPNYVFRLSMRDSWAMGAMVERAKARKLGRIGLLLPNTEWGRSGERAMRRLEAEGKAPNIVDIEWYNWGAPTLLEDYASLRKAGAEIIFLVANEREGVVMVHEVAAMPEEERLPILSHWGITGGNFFEGSGPALRDVDFAVVQTYSFIGATDPIAAKVIAAALRLGAPDARHIPSPVGVAHAYDLTRILAMAIDLAGTSDRQAIRDALEKVGDYRGLIMDYSRPFTPERHDALSPAQVFFARFAADGAIERVVDHEVKN